MTKRKVAHLNDSFPLIRRRAGEPNVPVHRSVNNLFDPSTVGCILVKHSIDAEHSEARKSLGGDTRSDLFAGLMTRSPRRGGHT